MRRRALRRRYGYSRVSPEKRERVFRRLDMFFGNPTNQRRGFQSEDAAASSAATLIAASGLVKYPVAIELVKEWYRR